jgi:hypothetical protein
MHSIAARVACVKHTHIATVAAQICCSGICFALTSSHEAPEIVIDGERKASVVERGGGTGKAISGGPINAI